MTYSTSPNPPVAVGNPGLEPEEVTSFDIGVEWYFAPASVVSLGYFHKERKDLLDMPFQREITKEEQADLGKLKKRVKGLIIIHPLTKIGKELRLEAVTGFAVKEF